jgi:hypothetical protein
MGAATAVTASGDRAAKTATSSPPRAWVSQFPAFIPDGGENQPDGSLRSKFGIERKRS